MRLRFPLIVDRLPELSPDISCAIEIIIMPPQLEDENTSDSALHGRD